LDKFNDDRTKHLDEVISFQRVHKEYHEKCLAALKAGGATKECKKEKASDVEQT
jgi:hypothetical protein